MKPPICEICGEDFREDAEGGLVHFEQTEKDKAWHERMKAEGMVGHPPEVAWFCGKHYAKANALSHLTLSDAIPQIRD